jgi:hypothetical protein
MLNVPTRIGEAASDRDGGTVSACTVTDKTVAAHRVRKMTVALFTLFPLSFVIVHSLSNDFTIHRAYRQPVRESDVAATSAIKKKTPAGNPADAFSTR